MTLEELEKTVQREQPDLSTTIAADGTVTIAFTDIVDSTVLIARLGDQAWLDVIRRHNGVIEQATTAHGGTVVETQGDGSMLAFSSARRAVSCAVTIQREIETSLVRELLSGADVGFLESREVELKGLAGSHLLFAVDLT